MCGALRASDAGKKAVLMGWVNRRRDLGSIIFIDLRDRTGVTQVVVNRELNPSAHDKAEQLRNEYVIAVIGTVKQRDRDTVNKNIPTGEVELVVEELRLLNESKQPPFLPGEAVLPNEEMRLKYRYIDLRRDAMQFNIEMRHKVSKAIRDYLALHGFFEIETPFMTRSTPEGARDYLVPSRVQPGTFYALPQSPQIFKQILMISGFDRYFQIVRCFRDEDLRADRQPEFTEVDVEMAFPQRDTLFDIIERLMEKLFALVDVKVERPFARLPYDRAMELYGSDKPHTGFGLEWKRVNLPPGAEGKVHVGQPLKALRVPGEGGASRSQLDKLQETAKSAGAEWFSYIKVGNPEVQSPLAKVVGEEPMRSLAESLEARPGDLVVLLGLKSNNTGPRSPARLDNPSGEVRLELARKLDLIKPGRWSFLWVVDFPMFEYNSKEARYQPMHHPFTSPREEDFDKLESDPGAVKARAYDLVLNGSEIGGGSIRIHRNDIQQRVFRVLGLTPEKARERFGFFLDALEYGTPPHGGIRSEE